MVSFAVTLPLASVVMTLGAPLPAVPESTTVPTSQGLGQNIVFLQVPVGRSAALQTKIADAYDAENVVRFPARPALRLVTGG